MFDFETLGNGTDTMVLSLGAVAYNKTGIISKTLFEFEMLDQVKGGRTFTASTLQWWMRQSEQARAVFQPNDFKLDIDDFFPRLEHWSMEAMKTVGEGWDQYKPWGNGANFDISILEDIYRRHHPKRDEGVPWKFWNVMCYRTFNVLTDCKRLVGRPHGTYHSALDDALFQTNTVLAYWRAQELKKGRNK